MSLWKSFAGTVLCSGHPLPRTPVRGPNARRLLIRSCLVAVLISAVFALVALADFIAARTYAAGIGARSVAVGDFNGDGILDLAVANVNNFVGATGTVSIFLGNGDGTFQVPQSYAAGSLPQSVAAGDYNGDGLPDVVVATLGSDAVTVLINAP